MTNCNDKAVPAGWTAGSEIPVQAVLCSRHSLSQGKAGDAAKTPSARPPHPFSRRQRGGGAASTEGDKAETVTPHAELGEEWNARAGAQGQMKEIWKETKQQPTV